MLEFVLVVGMSADIMIVVPWGRIYPIKKDVVESAKRKEEGGTGVGLAFWEWTEEQVKPYL